MDMNFHYQPIPTKSLLLSLALVSLFACSDSNSGGTDGNALEDSRVETLRQVCLETVNAYRASEGNAALTSWTAQEDCADNQAAQDQGSGTGHAHMGACGEYAQNTCPGWPYDGTTEGAVAVLQSCLQAMWSEGPGEPYSAHGHYINMSNSRYTNLVCGFSEQNGNLWVNLDFR